MPDASSAPFSSELLVEYLWLAGAGLLVAVLVGAFTMVLLRRYRSPLKQWLSATDEFLKQHMPRVWRFVRERFSPAAWHGLKLTSSVGLIFVLTYIFAGVTESWQEREVLYRIDHRVYEALGQVLGPQAVEVFWWITHAGDFLAVLAIGVPLGAYMAWQKHYWRLLAFLLTIVGAQAVTWTAKWGFSRTRPTQGFVEVASASFPSGHTLTATAFYGFIIFLFWRWAVSPWLRYTATAFLTAVILAVGLSRVIIGVHWASDVIGGLLLGLAWLLLSVIAVRALQAWKVPTEAHRAADDV